MFEQRKPPQAPRADASAYTFTHDEIDLLSECIERTGNYYKGMLLLKEDWNAAQNEQTIAYLKAKLRMLGELQEKTTYIGQSRLYKKEV